MCTIDIFFNGPDPRNYNYLRDRKIFGLCIEGNKIWKGTLIMRPDQLMSELLDAIPSNNDPYKITCCDTIPDNFRSTTSADYKAGSWFVFKA